MRGQIAGGSAHPKAHRRPSEAWRIVVERPHLGPMAGGSGASRRWPPHIFGPPRMSTLARVPSALMMYTTPRRALLLPRVTFGAARPSRPFPSLLAEFEW